MNHGPLATRRLAADTATVTAAARVTVVKGSIKRKPGRVDVTKTTTKGK